MALSRLSPLSISESAESSSSEQKVHAPLPDEQRHVNPTPHRRYAPPHAPTSELVARRILSHAKAVPIKRFDSADFFLEQHKQKSQHDFDAHLAGAPGTAPPPPPLELMEPMEPPLPSHIAQRDGLQCISPVAPCSSPRSRRD